MNCFRCIIERATDRVTTYLRRPPAPATTVYKGTALCDRHALEAELAEKPGPVKISDPVNDSIRKPAKAARHV